MSTFKTEVVKLGEIRRHPNADTLNIVNIWNYPVIFNDANGFKPGDLAAYIPIDSVCPLTPEWAWLGDSIRSHRIKAKKIRGVFSMGMLCPAPEGSKVGDDVSGILGITKYEEPEPIEAGSENQADPGFIPKYTNIESYRRYPTQLVAGEEVILTEKLHGCVRSNARVRTPTGELVPISKVKIGDYVLGVRNGATVPSKVINTYQNGKGSVWLTIKVSILGGNRGPHHRTLTCTPEHRLYDPTQQSFRPASEFAVGGNLLVHRGDISLTPLQEEILLGKILGDGSVLRHALGWSVEWGHTNNTLHTKELLGDLAPRTLQELMTSGYGSKIYRTGTVRCYAVQQYLADFYTGGRGKRVPAWVESRLTPIAMAFWFMDDGSLGATAGQETRANFAVCGFEEEDCQVLLRALRKYNIEGVYYQSKSPATGKMQSRIRLNANDAERFFALVAPYIHPSYQHKLPKRWQTGLVWAPKSDCYYKPRLLKQTIVSIERVTNEAHEKYDLETETENYVCHDILVHNSSYRATYAQDRLWIGSHNSIKRLDLDNQWTRIARQEHLEEKAKAFPNTVFYGELFGQVQDLHYGADQGQLFLAIFDVFRDGRYLDWSEAEQVILAAKLVPVPILYRGPWDQALLDVAEKDSCLGGKGSIREGFVVRPAKERWNDSIGRVVLKVISERYLLRKSGSERH